MQQPHIQVLWWLAATGKASNFQIGMPVMPDREAAMSAGIT
jgi:hypothetical protein